MTSQSALIPSRQEPIGSPCETYFLSCLLRSVSCAGACLLARGYARRLLMGIPTSLNWPRTASLGPPPRPALSPWEAIWRALLRARKKPSYIRWQAPAPCCGLVRAETRMAPVSDHGWADTKPRAVMPGATDRFLATQTLPLASRTIMVEMKSDHVPVLRWPSHEHAWNDYPDDVTGDGIHLVA